MIKTNKSVARILSLFSLVTALGPLTAQAASPMNFNVPFSFTVGTKIFDAGEYRITEVSPGALRIQSGDARINLVVLSNNDEHGKLDNQVTMSFNQYGGQFFLCKVSSPNRGWALLPSRAEKELIASRGQASKPLTVLASSRR